jgi:hypothetical protein
VTSRGGPSFVSGTKWDAARYREEHTITHEPALTVIKYFWDAIQW